MFSGSPWKIQNNGCIYVILLLLVMPQRAYLRTHVVCFYLYLHIRVDFHRVNRIQVFFAPPSYFVLGTSPSLQCFNSLISVVYGQEYYGTAHLGKRYPFKNDFIYFLSQNISVEIYSILFISYLPLLVQATKYILDEPT